MVENSRETSQASTVRSVDLPARIRVSEDDRGRPQTIWLKKQEAVSELLDHWRIDDEWWRAEEISRMYYEVILNSGRRIIIFKDLITDLWYTQNY